MATDPGGTPKKAAPKKAAPKTTAPKKVASAKKAAPTKKATANKAASPRRTTPLRATALPPPPPTEAPTVFTPPTAPPVVRAPEPTGEAVREDHVVLGFGGPQPQRRWTVALRFFLVLPHLFWFELISIAAFVALIVGWFGALFTGRLPEGIARFIAQWVRYGTRIYGYWFFLLTDEYPPFALDRDDYPITVEFAPGKLNRAAVFFRIVLMVPVSIVLEVVMLGSFLVGVVGWLITLVSGQLPVSLYQANAAVLAYQTRAQAYFAMLTAEYPGGLFGDKSAPLPLWDPDASGDDDVPALPATPRITRLVLERPARRTVGLMIAIGMVFFVGTIVVGSITVGQSIAAQNKLIDSHDRLGVAVNTFSSQAQSCALEGGADCLHQADVALANAFDRFRFDVEDISFPGNYDAGVEDLLVDARDCADALRAVADTTTPAAYQNGLRVYLEAARRFDRDYRDLILIDN